MQLPRAQSWVQRLSRAVTCLVLCAFGLHLQLGMATAAEARSRTIEVALVGALASEPTLTDRISSWFDPVVYDVKVSSRQVLATEEVLSPEADGTVYVWVVLKSGREVRLYFATTGPGGSAIYCVRSVALQHGLDEVAAERLSQIVHLSAVALFEGQGEQQREQVKRLLEEEPAAQEAPKPKSEPRLVPRSRPRSEPTESAVGSKTPIELVPGLGYGASLRGDEGIWHGPRVGLSLTIDRSWTLGLGIQGYLPHERELNQVRLAFWGLAFESGVGVRTRVADAWDLLARVGPGFELVSYEPVRSLSTQVSISEGETEVRPNFGAQTRLVWRGPLVDGELLLGAAYTLTRTHYDLETPGRPREIAAPSRVLPYVGLEVGF